MTIIVPDETNTFPGKRPRSIEDQRLTNGDEIPSCKNCTNLKLSIDQCPLMGVASCDRPGHPDFLIRYGRENFKGPGCPACRQDLKGMYLLKHFSFMNISRGVAVSSSSLFRRSDK
jgi:hypothetical protein